MAVRVLLVEDCEEDLELAMRVLRKKAAEVHITHAPDGISAWRTLCDSRGEHDLLLTDVKLPGVDGLELLRRVRESERLQRLPVVMLTSSSEERDVRRAYELGANSYVVKPVEPTQFSRVLEHIARYWTSVNVAAPP